MSLIRAYGFRVDAPVKPLLERSELADLTTAPARAAGTLAGDALHIAPPKEFWTPLDAPVPGTVFRGTLPGDHHARFVLRLPRDWSGRLVVAASSGVTDQDTYDLWFADHALRRGDAFAATDKGVRRCLLDGTTVLMPVIPEASVVRWPSRLEALASFAQGLAREARGKAPSRTYAVGLSNGGWVARKAAEAGFVDGAVEVSGVLWRADRGNLLRELPRALRASRDGRWDETEMAALGFAAPAPWDGLRAFYKSVYWEASLGLFTSDLDPKYEGDVADYDFDSRPASVRAAVESFQNTGDLKVPLHSVAGERDYLISCPGHARAYEALVKTAGKSALHRMEYVADAGHVDAHRELFPFVTPLMSRAHAAYEALVARVEAVPARS